jgi:dolichyl-phosphate beta-glucosyltransferase
MAPVTRDGMQDAALSIIIPCYNSSGFIRRTFAEIESFLGESGDTQVLFVDDASNDTTVSILQSLIGGSACARRMTLLRNPENSGKGAAIARGLAAVTTEFVCYTDADLAYDPGNIALFRSHARAGRITTANRVHADSVYLIRPHFFQHIASRHLASRVLNKFISLLLVPGTEDAQAGLKMGATADLKSCLPYLTCWRFSFDTELLTAAHARGMEIWPLPVRFKYDPDSSTVRFARDSRDMLLALARIWLRKVAGKYRG